MYPKSFQINLRNDNASKDDPITANIEPIWHPMAFILTTTPNPVQPADNRASFDVRTTSFQARFSPQKPAALVSGKSICHLSHAPGAVITRNALRMRDRCWSSSSSLSSSWTSSIDRSVMICRITILLSASFRKLARARPRVRLHHQQRFNCSFSAVVAWVFRASLLHPVRRHTFISSVPASNGPVPGGCRNAPPHRYAVVDF